MAEISGLTVCGVQWEEQDTDTAGVREFRSVWEDNVNIFYINARTLSEDNGVKQACTRSRMNLYDPNQGE